MLDFFKSSRKKDSDKDGLSDWEETHIYGSDPKDDDTDGDGIEDGEAVIRGMNPAGAGYFKDLFIPNKNNNYQPKSLHKDRIIFHISTAIVMKLIVVVFVISYPLSAWMTPDIARERSEQIIYLTNQLRTGLSLPGLVENQSLNQAAYNKVQDMFLNQYFAHTSPQKRSLDTFLGAVGYNYSVSGENLAMGFEDPEEVVEAWKNSPSHYANLIDNLFEETGVALADDIFKDKSTVFIAQYFARPKKESAPVVVPIVQPEEIIDPELINPDSKLVLSAQEEPASDSVQAKVIIDTPVGEDSTLVKVKASLEPKVEEARVVVLNQDLQLAEIRPGEWEGQEIIYNNEGSGPLVPASLTFVDSSGQEETMAIDIDNVQPRSTSLREQYFLLKNHPNSAIAKVLNINSIYFKIILILALISLILNIIIQIRKQNFKVILSAVTLILVLILLLLF